MYEEAEMAKCRKEYLEQLYSVKDITIDTDIDEEENQRDTEELKNFSTESFW